MNGTSAPTAHDDLDFGDVAVQIAELFVYPVKSCAGIAVPQVTMLDTGLAHDRAWMLVGEDSRLVTQRELPRMVLIQPALTLHELQLSAPGMPALHLPLAATGASLRVTVWRDEVAAFDMGEAAAQWFSDFLGQRLRLVRFDTAQPRLSDRQWTGPHQAPTMFADGYALLVTSTAGLAEFNRHLATAGHTAVTMARFRPNLVLDGLDAHGEDHLDEIELATGDGPLRLKLVKPCVRCPMPDIDPQTAERGHAVGDTLAAYRADARMDGALTFGMNAIVLEGAGRDLRIGQRGGASYRFD